MNNVTSTLRPTSGPTSRKHQETCGDSGDPSGIRTGGTTESFAELQKDHAK
jgi:hypothetical protein